MDKDYPTGTDTKPSIRPGVWKQQEFYLGDYFYIVMSDGTIWKYVKGAWKIIEQT